MGILDKILRAGEGKKVRAIEALVPEINALEPEIEQLSDEALTHKTIDQIAIEHGFPNRHYFTRMFARQTGCGPAEFRQRQHNRKGP